MDRRVRRAPDPEWKLMYRRGLSRGRIADLVRAPARTVAYHLAAARAEDPGLEDEHAAAAGTGGSATLTSKGRERMDQLIALVRSKG
jgi:hypothetical protein